MSHAISTTNRLPDTLMLIFFVPAAGRRILWPLSCIYLYPNAPRSRPGYPGDRQTIARGAEQPNLRLHHCASPRSLQLCQAAKVHVQKSMPELCESVLVCARTAVFAKSTVPITSRPMPSRASFLTAPGHCCLLMHGCR